MAFKRLGTSNTGTTKSRSTFQYRPRTSEEMMKRVEQRGGGSREGFVAQEISTWTPTDGMNKIRILPPTWDNAEHFGIEIFAHYNVGGDNSAYICLARTQGEACPICEARQELDRAGDTESAKALLPRKRVAMWVIDRSEESKGPLLWPAAWTLDQEIAQQAVDEEGGSVLSLDDPVNGYDVSFSRDPQGKDIPPKFTGVKVARKPSPISDDDDETQKILDYIQEHPVPACLVFHDYETIANAFEGKAMKRKEEEEAPTRARPSFGKKPAAREEEETVPATSELPTWDEVHEMDEDQVTAFAEEAGVDFGSEEFADVPAFQDWLCAQLDIEPAKKAKPTIGRPKPTIQKPSIDKKADEPAVGSWKSKLERFKAGKK